MKKAVLVALVVVLAIVLIAFAITHERGAIRKAEIEERERTEKPSAPRRHENGAQFHKSGIPSCDDPRASKSSRECE